MGQIRGSARRTLAALLALAVLSLMAAPVTGQPPQVPNAAPSPADKVFDPSVSEPVPGTTPTGEEDGEDGEDGEGEGEEVTTTEVDDAKVIADETVQQPGWGNARDQSASAKTTESERDCMGAPPPTNSMLGFPGTVAASEGDRLGRLILLVALSALIVAGIAYGLRHLHGRTTARGPLETVATVVGILGTSAGLAVTFIPGVGVRDSPVPAVTMEIGDVTRRIKQTEYAQKTRSKQLDGADGREVGNVIWLEIHLEGYGEKPLSLQYASFDPDPNGALLPGTAVSVALPHEDVDVETQFVPIWVGYPKSERFGAAFRLLHEGRVQAIAETGEMRSSRYRYSCEDRP